MSARLTRISGHLTAPSTAADNVEASALFKQNCVSPPKKFPKSAADYFNFDDLLSEEEKKIRYRVREFMETKVAPIVVPYWEKAEFPMALPEMLKSLKIAGGDIVGNECPGLSHMSFALIALEMARVDVSSSTFYLVHTGLAMASIDLCGNEEQKKRYLPAMARLEKIGCFGLTESDRGSDATSLQTTAKKVDGGWILNGDKRWIGNGTFADVIIIWAKNAEDGKINGFIVEKGTPGFSAKKIDNKISLRIVQNADMTLKDVFVPDKNKLGNAPDFAEGVGRVLEKSRIIVSWQPVGAAMGIFDHCLNYVKARKQFGVPIASYQLIQERLTRMLGTIQSMFLVSWRISRLFEAGKLTGGQSSLAKAYNTMRGREVAALGREILGGNGIVQDYHVARLFADMESLYTYEGTYDINSLVAGREVTGVAAIRAPNPKKKKH